MERYIGVDAHGTSCTFGVIGPSGRKLRNDVVETNGAALVSHLRSIPGRKHLCLEEGTQSAWLYEHYLRLMSAGTRPNLAKVTIARRVAAIVLRMWKDEKEYDPGKLPNAPRDPTTNHEEHCPAILRQDSYSRN